MVTGTEMFSHLPSGEDVRRPFHTHRKAVQLIDVLADQCSDDARVEPTGEKHTQGNVAHQPLDHCGFKPFPYGLRAECRIRIWWFQPQGVEPPMKRTICVGESCWDFLDVGTLIN